MSFETTKLGTTVGEATKTGAGASSNRIYRIGKDLEGNSILKSGWGEPERGFVWSEGKVGTLVVPAFHGDNTLSISLWGYVPKDLRQETLLFINGSLKGIFEIVEKTIITVSHNIAAAPATMEVLFYIPSAISPQAAEGATDARQLGIALSTIQVSCDSPRGRVV